MIAGRNFYCDLTILIPINDDINPFDYMKQMRHTFPRWTEPFRIKEILSRDEFFLRSSQFLWRTSKIKFVLASMKSLTNCENPSSKPLQGNKSGFLLAACIKVVPKAAHDPENQCCGFMIFWYGYGSGSADPSRWLMDPLPFSSLTFKMPTKNLLLFFYFFYLLHHFSKIKSQKESQNSRNQGFSYYFCMMIEGSGSVSGSIPLTNASGSGKPKNKWIRNTAENCPLIRPWI